MYCPLNTGQAASIFTAHTAYSRACPGHDKACSQVRRPCGPLIRSERCLTPATNKGSELHFAEIQSQKTCTPTLPFIVLLSSPQDGASCCIGMSSCTEPGKRDITSCVMWNHRQAHFRSAFDCDCAVTHVILLYMDFHLAGQHLESKLSRWYLRDVVQLVMLTHSLSIACLPFNNWQSTSVRNKQRHAKQQSLQAHRNT